MDIERKYAIGSGRGLNPNCESNAISADCWRRLPVQTTLQILPIACEALFARNAGITRFALTAIQAEEVGHLFLMGF